MRVSAATARNRASGSRPGAEMLDHPRRDRRREVRGLDCRRAAEVAGQEAAGERVAGAGRVDEVVGRRRDVGGDAVVVDERAVGVELQHDQRLRIQLGQRGGDRFRIVEAGQHFALLVVGQEHVDAEVLGDGEELVDAHLLDHLERAGIERQRRAALAGQLRSGARR